jgi:predicted transcriptional regulator
MNIANLKIGDKVLFHPSPRAKSKITGTVVKLNAGLNGQFLEINGADDKVRKVRPSACAKVG